MQSGGYSGVTNGDDVSGSEPLLFGAKMNFIPFLLVL